MGWGHGESEGQWRRIFNEEESDVGEMAKEKHKLSQASASGAVGGGGDKSRLGSTA